MDSSDQAAANLPVTRRRREADEWALVLTAEGLAPTITRSAQGYRIDLPPNEIVRAAEILAAWRIERSERAAQVEPPPVRNATAFEVAIAYALALALLAFHVALDRSDRGEILFEAGANQARLVADGEVWRLITALTLHSGLPHVLGNTFFGGFFMAFVAGRLGIGFAALAFVVTGALGNFANDLYYGFDHLSVGASTGVFGLVGVLCGFAAWRRHQIAPPRRGAWVAFAAGLGIIAMLGSGGPRVDVSAHLFGMLVGGGAGLIVAIPMAAALPPGRFAQGIALATALTVIGGAWTLAL